MAAAKPRTTKIKSPLYIALVSIHGLVRGHNIELGRDADTGGQIKYVVELTRALAQHEGVERVDLFTRRIVDNNVSADYGKARERLTTKANIIRLPCGSGRYIRKEKLWNHLDNYIDHALQYFREIGRTPDIIHGHYADAGYVGARLASLLGVPFVFTGHSLGRVKQQRLLENGLKPEKIESRYHITQRIEAEEVALDHAAMVVASTQQEVEEQYALYDNHHDNHMRVIPPGVDLTRFHPPKRGAPSMPMESELARFLAKPQRPMVLAISRADERKNIATLVRAFAEHPGLRKKANLVIVAGNRDDLQDLDRGARDVLTRLLLDIDRYDLYGHVAYPKHHRPNDIPDLYRIAAKSKGVFVNPALTEPFGLTLIEAAASGLPMVATEDGGPRDIVKHCKNGFLVDPLDADAMGERIYDALSDRTRWRNWVRAGINGANRYYAWAAHVEHYLKQLKGLLRGNSQGRLLVTKNRLPLIDRLLVCDIDDTLIGNRRALKELMARIKAAGPSVGFAIATARTFTDTQIALKSNRIPIPDVLITSAGAEIHYGHWMVQDVSWERHIHHHWDAMAIDRCIHAMPGVDRQPRQRQNSHKLSYYIGPDAPAVDEVVRALRQEDLHAHVTRSRGRYMDVTPIRASKALALKYLAFKWGLDFDHILVAGGSGNDEELLRGNALSVVVGNYSEELDRLQGRARTFFAEGHYAQGVLEGVEFYNFLADIRVPNEEAP